MNIKQIFKKPEYFLMTIIIFFIIVGVLIFAIILLKKEEVKVSDEEKVEYVAQVSNLVKDKENEIIHVTVESPTPEPTPELVEQLQDIAEPTPTPTPLEPTYQGFAIGGRITIPKTGVDTPFMEKVTVSGMEVAPCLLLNTGELNVSGNAFIIGHNYRNGTLFSNNKYLENGDKIIITAMNGTSKEYTIYDKFITTPEDTKYLKRELQGAEITLQCCTDDDNNRIIILAR